MDVLGDAITRDRRSAEAALAAPAVGRRYDYRRFCTSAWKTGNFLSHIGVRGGAGVVIADDPLPEPVLTLYGAAALGAVVSVDPPAEIGPDVRAVVAPQATFDTYTFGPETKGVVYGDAPDDPSVSYFERDVWSENPTAPPDRVERGDPLLRTASDTYSHGAVLRAANAVVDQHELDADSVVAVGGSFTEPGVIVAGLIAPIVAGGEIVLGPDADSDHIVGGPESDVETTALLGE